MATFFGIHFLSKTYLCEQNHLYNIFLEKCWSAVPKKIRWLIKPLLKNKLLATFPQFFKALDHKRVQFTLVGLFPGFTIAADFSRAAPAAKRRKEGLFQKQLPSSKPNLSQKNQIAFFMSFFLSLSLPLPLPLPLSLSLLFLFLFLFLLSNL